MTDKFFRQDKIDEKRTFNHKIKIKKGKKIPEAEDDRIERRVRRLRFDGKEIEKGE